MSQRADQIQRRALTTDQTRLGRLTGLTLGYGYQPWRALLSLVAVVSAAAALAASSERTGGLAPQHPRSTTTDCSTSNRSASAWTSPCR